MATATPMQIDDPAILVAHFRSIMDHGMHAGHSLPLQVGVPAQVAGNSNAYFRDAQMTRDLTLRVIAALQAAIEAGTLT